MKRLCLLLILTCLSCSSTYNLKKPVEPIQSSEPSAGKEEREQLQIKKASAILQRIAEIETEGKKEREQREAEMALGMTKSQATTLWGSPQKINRTRTTVGTSEQWVYSRNRYLYFDNGILTAIQDELKQDGQ